MVTTFIQDMEGLESAYLFDSGDLSPNTFAVDNEFSCTSGTLLTKCL